MTTIFSRRAGLAVVAALSVLATVPVAAATAGPSAAPTAAPVDATLAGQARPNTRYCVLIPAETGTIINRKVCHTRDQWLATGFDPLAKK